MSDYAQLEQRFRSLAHAEIAEAALKRLSGLPDAEDDAAICDARVRDYNDAADALVTLTRELEEAKERERKVMHDVSHVIDAMKSGPLRADLLGPMGVLVCLVNVLSSAASGQEDTLP